MADQQYEYGMIGLGTMGRNLLLNMVDRGFSVAGYDKDPNTLELLNKEGAGKNLHAFATLEQFIQSLKQPRVIIILVPAGRIVDAVIEEVKPFLNSNDLLVDCGNSHFTDTNRRINHLNDQGIHFMGTGVSGGEAGARFGPSIMPGGNAEAYQMVKPVFEAIAAKANGVPCVAYMGKGSAGHYVKMVHNGIEYAIMQAIAESYQMLKQLGGLNNTELQVIFESYNQSAIRCYLLEITSAIFSEPDDLTENRLLDMILDSARQKGTGAWSSQDAMNLMVPTPAIDASVVQREISGLKNERIFASNVLNGPDNDALLGHDGLVPVIEDTLHFCMICIYAQGLALIKAASQQYQYDTDPVQVASVWRDGCIIRADMLEDIRKAFQQEPALQNLVVSELFAGRLNKLQKHTRSAIISAVSAGIPVPVMMSNLAYYDSYRSAWLPANLLQAQRDFFGAHTYERIDRTGSFHTNWQALTDNNG